MRQFLAVAGPIVGNFVFWSLITVVPMHALILLALVVGSGVLMLCGMVFFGKMAANGH